MSEFKKQVKSVKAPNVFGEFVEFTPDDYQFSIVSREIIITAKEPNKSWITQTYLRRNCKIEYEKPKLLKRADGSLISEPEEYSECVCIIQNINRFHLKRTIGEKTFIFGFNPSDICEQEALIIGYLFLKEDTRLAEKKAAMLTKQLEIQFEIDRLNAEQNWVADWLDYNHRKYFFNNDAYAKEIKISSTVYNNYCQKVMSKKTAETILAKYTQDELKQYLGIIN